MSSKGHVAPTPSSLALSPCSGLPILPKSSTAAHSCHHFGDGLLCIPSVAFSVCQARATTVSAGLLPYLSECWHCSSELLSFLSDGLGTSVSPYSTVGPSVSNQAVLG